MTIHDPQVFRRLLTGGAIAFAECYIDGLWDTPDLPGLLELLPSAGDLEEKLAEMLHGVEVPEVILAKLPGHVALGFEILSDGRVLGLETEVGARHSYFGHTCSYGHIAA